MYRYLFRFSWMYIALLFIVFLIVYLSSIDPPPMHSLLVSALAAHAVGIKFVKDNQRVFTRKEKWRMIFGSLAIVLVLAAVQIAMLWEANPQLKELPASLLPIGFAIMLPLTLLSLYLGYGRMTNFYAKKNI